MSAAASASFVVRGRVQGVGFRWFINRIAHELGLAGWVRNLPDGSVEVQAWGNAAQLAALADALSSGPAGARVESVEKSNVPPQAIKPKTFEIR